MCRELKLTTGMPVTVRAFVWKDMERLLALWRSLRAGIAEEEFAAIEHEEIASIIPLIAEKTPAALEGLVGIATGLPPGDMADWSLVDLISIGTAILEVNRVEVILPVLVNFFSQINRASDAISPPPGGCRS